MLQGSNHSANYQSDREAGTYKGKGVHPGSCPFQPSAQRPANRASMRPTSPFVTVHEGRKRFRQLESALAPANHPPHAAVCASGLFDLLCDELVSQLMHDLAALPSDACGCLDIRSNVLSSARSLSSLLLTCRRMVCIYGSTARQLKREMAARAATQIMPGSIIRTTPYPFTEQVERENVSRDQLSSLKEGMTKLAVHCAGPCCEPARLELNGRQKKIYPATRQSCTTSASLNGDYAFVAYRSRNAVPSKLRGARRFEAGVQRRTEWLARLERPGMGKDSVREVNRVELDTGGHSAPQSMRASQCGTMVAVIRSVHTASLDPLVPHACVSVWDTRESVIRGGVLPPDEAMGVGAINAQDAWWTSGEDGVRLTVLWSTAYLHPIGTVVGANSDTCCYFFSQHSLSDGSWDLVMYTGPFSGKAQTASPSADGSRVAVLVRKPKVGNGPASFSSRSTIFHDVHTEALFEINHRDAIGLGRGVAPLHPHDVATCPSAVGLSPSGDCLVAVHRRYFSVVAEVLICTAPSSFVSVQAIDLTHWISVGRSETSAIDAANTLKLPYSIVFSPCGRFAAIVDQRPMFGMAVMNHSMVVLDLSMRHERRGIRALPLGTVEDVAPRSVEWTPAGFWLQPRHGSLFVTA